jgi:hypothetical protein
MIRGDWFSAFYRVVDDLGRMGPLKKVTGEDPRSRAGALVEGLTDMALRNVRNLQEAVGLVGGTECLNWVRPGLGLRGGNSPVLPGPCAIRL